MEKRCVICEEEIEEPWKLKGTLLKSRNENNINELIYVCSGCQKKNGWIERAKIKGA